MVKQVISDVLSAPSKTKLFNAGRRFLLIIILAAAMPTAHAASAPITDDPALLARAQKLEENLRCLVCQNQSIAESTADLANDLRNQVREQLRAGKSEQQIIDYMVERYGDFVLYDPPFRAETLLLWLGPAALLLIALGGFAWTLRSRRREQQDDAPLSAADHARAAALLGEELDKKLNTQNVKPLEKPSRDNPTQPSSGHSK